MCQSFLHFSQKTKSYARLNRPLCFTSKYIFVNAFYKLPETCIQSMAESDCSTAKDLAHNNLMTAAYLPIDFEQV